MGYLKMISVLYENKSLGEYFNVKNNLWYVIEKIRRNQTRSNRARNEYAIFWMVSYSRTKNTRTIYAARDFMDSAIPFITSASFLYLPVITP